MLVSENRATMPDSWREARRKEVTLRDNSKPVAYPYESPIQPREEQE
jgi:hypothetical protein